MSGFLGGGGSPVIKKAGTEIGQQPAINFIEGANVTLTISEDTGNGEVDVTVAATTGGTLAIQDEGSPQGAATTINFVGSGVSAAVAGSTATITMTGGSGDVVGPASATDNAVARFDTTTGELIQNSAVTIDDSGNIATAGTVDGRDISVDGTKLDGIEALADVTDAANVAAAGAVMTSAIGSTVQAYDADLAAIAALTSAADRVPYFTGSGTAALATFTSAGRALVDDADASAQRTTLGLGTAATSATGDFAAASHTHAAGDITSGTIATARLGSGVADNTSYLRGDQTWVSLTPGDALTTDPLDQFASTTSAQLAGVISDETGSGALVFANTPTLVTPVLGVATATSVNKVAVTAPATSATLTIADGATLTCSANATVSGTNTGDQTNITGNAATVTTNANLTGPVTSVGNATTITDAAVTLAKMANLAQDQFIGRVTASTGVPETATITAAARTVLDDTTVGAMLTTMGGATLASPTFTGNVAITIPSTNTTAGTTQTIDWNNGNAQVFDAQGSSGNVTFTFSNPKSGASYVLKLIQGSSARTYTWPATVKWPAATAPTVTATNDAVDMCTFFYDGTNYLASFTLDHR